MKRDAEKEEGGEILFLLSDPYNQCLVEFALFGIPYEKDGVKNSKRTLYRIRSNTLYGNEIIDNLKEIVSGNDEQNCEDPIHGPRGTLIICDFPNNAFIPGVEEPGEDIN